MNRAAIPAVLVIVTAGSVAFAQRPPKPDHVPPPPQTQGQLNSMAAKQPAKPAEMKPLASAAQATPRKKPSQPVAESKPKQAEAERQ
jgi:hypothetical protein